MTKIFLFAKCQNNERETFLEHFYYLLLTNNLEKPWCWKAQVIDFKDNLILILILANFWLSGKGKTILPFIILTFSILLILNDQKQGKFNLI